MKVKHVDVINQGEEETKGNSWAIMQNMKVGKNKKGFDEQITLVHTNRRKEDGQISEKGVMIKKTKEILEHEKHQQNEGNKDNWAPIAWSSYKMALHKMELKVFMMST